jgi:uncharacterized membrane protein YcaP (DUF421 family)
VPAIDWPSLWAPKLHPAETVLRAALVYLFTLVIFRVAGRKAIGRWGVPEVVLVLLVTVAVRRSIVVDDESITTAMIALATLAALDRLLGSFSRRSLRAADMIEGPVIPLVRDGVIDREGMARARLAEDELLSRVRAHGHTSLDEIRLAWFERSGEVTIVFR